MPASEDEDWEDDDDNEIIVVDSDDDDDEQNTRPVSRRRRRRSDRLTELTSTRDVATRRPPFDLISLVGARLRNIRPFWKEMDSCQHSGPRRVHLPGAQS